ncbi:hypothetical protein [Pseudoalteromonas sp. Ps84H-4]|uniref:hypothetical protein n=1 Tax=Pseudoalteromonas sp. Ps84H-4 TaxID=2954502 RepID=UPI0020984A25|nr:hypothetical protein [Pseudoalteromonas sp. Ps84H-4]MCO7252133.1 hypothetical protein [Pseudoalteromonas sp. Ps84H-4]
MKNIRFFALIACSIPLFVILTAYSRFGFSPQSSIEQWGAFGDFMGGVLNPIFAFLSFLCLLIAIVLQNLELKETRKEFSRLATANEEQVSIISKQHYNDDTYKVIQIVTDRINRNYNENNLMGNSLSLKTILLGKVNYNENPDFKFLYSKGIDTNSIEYKVLRTLENDLTLLKELLIEYSNLQNFNSVSPLVNFYKNEYEHLVSALTSHSLINTDLRVYYLK